MSAASDKYEKDVADYLKMSGVDAERPSVSVKYPDIRVNEYKSVRNTWIEVKMNHTDNLGNTRVTYMEGKWIAAAPLDPVKKFAIDYLSKNQATISFLKDIAKFAGMNWEKMILPSTKGPLKEPNAVSYETVAKYFKSKSQYILNVPNVDLGKLVTDHYLQAKAEPASYMQAGDDFYMIGTSNPLKLPRDVPVLGAGGRCKGNFKMRVGVRSTSSGFYEIQPEIKITNMENSKYSIKPGTNKLNPFKIK